MLSAPAIYAEPVRRVNPPAGIRVWYENNLRWPREPPHHDSRASLLRPLTSSYRPSFRHLYVENASQMGPNCGVWVREVSLVIWRAGQLHGGAGPE